VSQPNTVEVIQNAYAAFKGGQIEALLGMMSDDIDWEFHGPKEIPMTGLRRGKAEVGRFFQQVGATWNFEKFEPRQFIAQGDVVVALGAYGGTSKATGRKFGAEFSHVFTVKSGRVARFREYTDTANLLHALEGSAARA
jgi:uncharacterized protein